MSRLPVAVPGQSLALAAQGLADGSFGWRLALSAALRAPFQCATARHGTAPLASVQRQQPLALEICAGNNGGADTESCNKYLWGSSSTKCTRHHMELLHGWAAGQAAFQGGLWAQQYRCYAVKAKGGGKAAPVPAAAAPKPRPAADPYAPPQWVMKRVPRGPKGNALARAAPQQRALLQQLSPDGAGLRSLRQLGWPLGQQHVLGLLHDQLADVAHTNVSVVPFVLDSMYQSAASLASVVKDYLAEGRGMPQVEQYLLTTIAALPAAEIPFEGIKVAVKGRMSGKSGMTSRRVWTWGRTSSATLSDPVDYAHEAVITRAGYIGIKVWIRYKRSQVEDQRLHSSRSCISLSQLLSMPAPRTLPSRSSSAWWNTHGPLQPQQHRAHQAFQPGYDTLTASNELQK